MIEKNRVENEDRLQIYLRSLIETDRDNRTKLVIEKYRQTNGSTEKDIPISIDIGIQQQLKEIDREFEQILIDVNQLFNEAESRRNKREIPEYLTCKLCYDLMRDPMITPCKIISFYEKLFSILIN